MSYVRERWSAVPQRTRAALTVAVVVVAALAATLLHGRLSAPLRPTACAAGLARSSYLADPPFDFGAARVDVLGDSYSVGATLTDPRVQTWDVLLARAKRWHLTVRGISATGFVNGGACGDRTYGARVHEVLADRPSLVVVEGGLNDVHFDPAQVERSARALLAAFPRTLRVVVVGPPPAPAHAVADEHAVDRALSAAVGSQPNREYISTVDWRLTYSPDRLHLDAAGNRVFAARLADAIR